MEKANRKNRNLKIFGDGTASGGVYNNVVIRGVADIDGVLDCANFKVTGVCNIHGGLQAKLFKLVGTSDVDGSISADEVKIVGEVTVRGDCNAESLAVMGGFTIDGLLNAGKIDISPYGLCEVKEMGGETIQVRTRFRMFVGYQHLICETIEGDDIKLEYTKARVVRGNKVSIGPGCEIGLVEYKEYFAQAKEATVNDCKKI
ncbi:Polymer-forming cytoskeletal [Pelotomaculum sp. FP]|uniref:hypothetical protein n=1 Tax=Pelotomaculum sp. FP TaxID=261474 RepID=UPI0011005B37|nr:hypothetical protein [Pelotomaculum sp. FP]TEB10674.1 Polymer-forming cytoskeletal [Pelotomaculum sp. FP]